MEEAWRQHTAAASRKSSVSVAAGSLGQPWRGHCRCTNIFRVNTPRTAGHRRCHRAAVDCRPLLLSVRQQRVAGRVQGPARPPLHAAPPCPAPPPLVSLQSVGTFSRIRAVQCAVRCHGRRPAALERAQAAQAAQAGQAVQDRWCRLPVALPAIRRCTLRLRASPRRIASRTRWPRWTTWPAHESQAGRPREGLPEGQKEQHADRTASTACTEAARPPEPARPHVPSPGDCTQAVLRDSASSSNDPKFLHDKALPGWLAAAA